MARREEFDAGQGLDPYREHPKRVNPRNKKDVYHGPIDEKGNPPDFDHPLFEEWARWQAAGYDAEGNWKPVKGRPD